MSNQPRGACAEHDAGRDCPVHGPRAGRARRWTLIDQSEDYTPRWEVVTERAPVADEYAESVEVMPVAEHEAFVRDMIVANTQTNHQLVKWLEAQR